MGRFALWQAPPRRILSLMKRASLPFAWCLLALMPVVHGACPLQEPEASAAITAGDPFLVRWTRDGVGQLFTRTEIRTLDVELWEIGRHTASTVAYTHATEDAAIAMFYLIEATPMLCDPVFTPLLVTGEGPLPTPTPAAPPPAIDPGPGTVTLARGWLTRDGSAAYLSPLRVANNGAGPLTISGLEQTVTREGLALRPSPPLPLVVPPGEARELIIAVESDGARLDDVEALGGVIRLLTDAPGAGRLRTTYAFNVAVTAGDIPEPTPSPTPSPTPTATPTATSTPTATPTVTPSATPTPTPACPDAQGDGVIDAADTLACAGTALPLLLGCVR